MQSLQLVMNLQWNLMILLTKTAAKTGRITVLEYFTLIYFIISFDEEVINTSEQT